MADNQTAKPPSTLARIEGETSKWFERFLAFVRLEGNLSATVAEEIGGRGKARKGIPGAWSRAMEKYRWRARYERFLEAQQDQERRELSAELLEQRKRRVNILRRATVKLSRALKCLLSGSMTWDQFFRGFKVISEASREEIDLAAMEETVKRLESKLEGIEQ